MKFKSVIYAVFLSMLLLNCTKETNKVLATVTIPEITSITDTTAIYSAEVTSDGGSKVVLKGVHWSSTESIPNLKDNTTNDSLGTGSFTNTISGLKPGITYKIWAFAYTSAGIAYSSEATFTTLNTIPF